MVENEIFVPGQKLCDLKENIKAGYGTFELDGAIIASIVGCRRIVTQDNNTILVEVDGSRQTLVPHIDDIVTVRITNVNPRFAKCSIIGISDITLRDSFRAVIRCEDIKATEKDKVDMSRSFRPGDIVIAKVISLGDSQSFLLSTAENELGVVVAISDVGVQMLPISWCEMQCPLTYVKQYRKVAKVQSSYIDK